LPVRVVAFVETLGGPLNCPVACGGGGGGGTQQILG